MAATTDRRCRACDVVLAQRRGEPRWNWAKRRYCDNQCAARVRALRNGVVPKPVAPPVFPGATHEKVSEVPDLCPRCNGPLTLEPGAFACRTCARRIYVRALLRYEIFRGQTRDDAAAEVQAQWRQRQGTRGPKLSVDQVRTIKRRLQDGASFVDLADHYDVTAELIRAIRRGTAWKGVSI